MLTLRVKRAADLLPGCSQGAGLRAALPLLTEADQALAHSSIWGALEHSGTHSGSWGKKLGTSWRRRMLSLRWALWWGHSPQMRQEPRGSSSHVEEDVLAAVTP